MRIKVDFHAPACGSVTHTYQVTDRKEAVKQLKQWISDQFLPCADSAEDHIHPWHEVHAVYFET